MGGEGSIPHQTSCGTPGGGERDSVLVWVPGMRDRDEDLGAGKLAGS